MHKTLIAKKFAGDDGRLHNLQHILCLARNIAKVVWFLESISSKYSTRIHVNLNPSWFQKF